MMKNTIVLYHANCCDGFTAAWAVYKSLGGTADYFPVQYGKPLTSDQIGTMEENPYDHLVIVDFSYPKDELLNLFAYERTYDSVTILDHHRTAEQELAPVVADPPEGWHVEFDMKRSGAMMAWHHFHPKEEPPVLVDYVQDRDLWLWEMLDSKEINTVIQMSEKTFQEWDAISLRLNHPRQKASLVKEGKAMLTYQEAKVAEICGNPGFTRLEGYTVPCVNNGSWQSEIGNVLSRTFPFAVSWFMNNDGYYIYSLRSSAENPNHLDVSEIAKRFGGGGHRHAAGFRASAPPIMV